MLKILQLTNQGVFSAPRSGSVRQRNVAVDPKIVAEADRAMEGVLLNDEACDWKVLEVSGSGKDRKVIVGYFDVALAAEQKITEEYMRSAPVTSRNSIDPLERSSVSEIRACIMASKRG